METFTPKERRCELCKRAYAREDDPMKCPVNLLEDKFINDDFYDPDAEEDADFIDDMTADDVEEVIQEINPSTLMVITAILGCESFIVLDELKR